MGFEPTTLRVLDHGGSWVRIPSGAQIFSVSSYGLFFTSPFISFNNKNTIFIIATQQRICITIYQTKKLRNFRQLASDGKLVETFLAGL